MGRETKLLLAVLAALTGAFVGVLSMKLLVSRPPSGTGPDVEVPHQLAEAQDLVEPPALEPGGLKVAGYAAAPALMPQPPEPASPAAAPLRDPFVSQAALTQPDLQSQEPAETVAELAPPPMDLAPLPAQPASPRASAQPVDEPPQPLAPPTAAAQSFLPSPLPESQPSNNLPITGSHVAQPGDSWWSLAERAYGDGRLYRALFAWNRALAPRVALTPGTQLYIPPQPRLQAAWPKLVPQQ